MKKILLAACVSLGVCFLPLSARAGAIWYNTSGDNMWNTVGNWSQNPEGNTCIFRATGTSPAGTIYVNADAAPARIRQQSGAAERELTIASTNLADVTFTLTGAAETWDGGSATSNWVINAVGTTDPNTNGAKLKLKINSFQPWSIGPAGISVVLNLDVSGVGGFVRASAGTLELNGTNTYSGANTFNEGAVLLGSPFGLGFGGDGTTVSAGGVLDLNGQSGVNEILTLNGDGTGGEGALINNSGTAASVAGGVLSSITVTTGGSGYSIPTTVSLSGGGGSGATAEALLGLTTASITLDNGGSGYDEAPYVVFVGGGGSGAAATSAIDENGVVTNITVTAPGSGYTSAPTIEFWLAGITGSGAAATASTTEFTVTGARLTDAGSGYTSAPTVGFSGGSGSGATASANFTSVTLASDSSVGGSGDITIEQGISGGFGLTKVGGNTLTLPATNTYSGNTTAGEGVLALGAGGSIASSPLIDVQLGATFDVSAVSGGFLLGAAQTLKGNGTVSGNVTADGTIAPGASVGTLALNGDLTLAGDLLVEVDKSLSPSNDLVTVSGTLTNAGTGTVTVVKLGGTSLVAGDSFQLFDQAVLNGDALTVVGAGVTWTNMLDVDGSIAVVSVSPPVPATNVTIAVVAPTSYSLSGLGGADSLYSIYASTNVALPMSNWWVIGSTISDGGGLIQFVDSQATNDQRFYRFGQ